MFFASINGVHREAAPHLKAVCPLCDQLVVPKCGQIISWHWAHKAGQDCDHWSEPMTAWHKQWQERFPKSMREQVITRTEEIGPDDPRFADAVKTLSGDRHSITEVHRADIKLLDGVIIEFQHSAISVDTIAERERFYGEKQIWVFDATEAVEKDRLTIYSHRAKSRVSKTIGTERFRTFHWAYPRKSIAHCQRTIYLDLGDDQLLKISDITGDATNGRGFVLSYDEFVKQVGIDETYWEPNPDFIEPRGSDEYDQFLRTLDLLPRCIHCHRPCTVPNAQKTSDGTPAHLSCQQSLLEA